MAVSSEELKKGIGGTSSTSSKTEKVTDRINFESIPFQVKITDSFDSKAAAYKYLTENYGDESSFLFNSNSTIQEINKLAGNRESPAEFFGLDTGDGLNVNLANDVLLAKNFQDTRVGGNDAYNCVWQFGPDDDIMHDIHTCDEQNHIGLGRVYASTTQQNQVICWFSFGLPHFSSLGSFYQSAFNTDLIKLNAAGWNADILLGALFDAAALCISLPLLPIRLFNSLANPYDVKVGRFYELRACMPLYYRYVDSILAQWLVSVGLFNNGPDGSASWTADPEYIPDALNGSASIYDILDRRKRNLLNSSKTVRGSIGSSRYGNSGVNGSFNAMGRAQPMDWDNKGGEGENAVNITQKIKSANPYELSALKYLNQDMSGDNDSSMRTSQNEGGETLIYEDTSGSWWKDFISSALGATQFVGFRIDNSTSANESFSNSTQPSSFAQKFNEDVRSKQDEHLQSALNGDFGNGVIGQFLSNVTSTAGGILKEGVQAIDSLFGTRIFSNIGSAMFSGAFLDIPDSYSSSDFSKSHSINMTLKSPYGDLMSIYQSIIVPLALVLAGVMPRAGGSDSYMQPFLFRAYCKGFFSIPMGIMESVSITRGSSEFGWTYNSLPSCVDVSISLKDLSPMMYMMVADNIFQNPFSENSSFKEYMLTIAGCGLWERISVMQRWRRNIQYTAHRLRNTLPNPSFWSHNISQWGLVQSVASIIPANVIPKNR